MIDFSKIDLSTIETHKTDLVYKSIEVTSKGVLMSELEYYVTGTLYTTASGVKKWDNVYVRMYHPNMAMSYEFTICRDINSRIDKSKMEAYTFAAQMLDNTLNKYQEENEK